MKLFLLFRNNVEKDGFWEQEKIDLFKDIVLKTQVM